VVESGVIAGRPIALRIEASRVRQVRNIDPSSALRTREECDIAFRSGEAGGSGFQRHTRFVPSALRLLGAVTKGSHTSHNLVPFHRLPYRQAQRLRHTVEVNVMFGCLFARLVSFALDPFDLLRAVIRERFVKLDELAMLPFEAATAGDEGRELALRTPRNTGLF
jgi:hypothetical protein